MRNEASRPRTLGALLDGFASVEQGADVPVGALRIDSRQISEGDIFFALNGTREHGLVHASGAMDRGAAAVIYELEGAPEITDTRGVPHLGVAALGHRLGEIASRFLGDPSAELDVVGVTGTDGKTSTTYYLAQALSGWKAESALLGTVGYGPWGALSAASHTTPDPIRLQGLLRAFADDGIRQVAMEVSSHALDQRRESGVHFHSAVLTNLSRDHLDYHGSVEAYARAKRRLFERRGLSQAVLNADDALGEALIGELKGKVPTVAYSMNDGGAAKSADRWVLAQDARLSERGIQATVAGSWGSGLLNAGLLGRFNLANLLAALAVMLGMGMPMHEALGRLSRVSNAPGRMERFGGGESPLIVVDYAHTPAALVHALEALREHCKGRLHCVFGCGGNRDSGKRALMGEAAERLADRVTLTDDNPRDEDGKHIIADILMGTARPHQVNVDRDRGSAIREAWDRARVGDIVLVAGKGHEDYQIVGTERLAFSDRSLARDLAGVNPDRDANAGAGS
ncbi:MAG: UDP-N-acetylmuramoyl-L-alanyl-D-glutamate--2,6-diaminopimelate ligase [Gammaproteobacteria bacterium]